jgi:hypothetical protein
MSNCEAIAINNESLVSAKRLSNCEAIAINNESLVSAKP